MSDQSQSTDKIIDCWDPSEPDLSDYRKAACEAVTEAFKTFGTGPIERWFKKELSDALRVLITQDGAIGISFDEEDNPVIKFWAAQWEELTYAESLSGELTKLVSDWVGDLEDEHAGPKNRRQLWRLRDVLRSAVDRIETALGDVHG